MPEWWLWGTNPRTWRYAGRVHIVLEAPGAAGAWAACGLRVATITEHRPAANNRVLCPECCLRAIDRYFPEPVVFR